MSDRSSIFDMIGPVMIGPSSSHTAGVVRIGRVTRKIYGKAIHKATVTFYNSFARTYEGHGSDKAIVAGLLDFKTDDKRIKNAFVEAEKADFEYTFKAIGNASEYHPNTIMIEIIDEDQKLQVIGESLGGGLINIARYKGFRADFSATMHTLIITAQDVTGSIAFIADVIAHDLSNIASMTVSRKGKNDIACQFYEMDTKLKPTTIQYLQHLDWVNEVIYLPDIDL